jgi:hypothetical protein
MYRVLSTRPQTERSGEVTHSPEGEIKWHRVKAWPELGTAKDMQEAREKFGGRPVLQWIGRLQ